MNVGLWPQVIVSSVSLAGLLVMVGLSWVVIFRTTKVFNFATGEYAIVGAYLFYELNAKLGLNWWISALGGITGGGLLGALTYIGLLRPLAGRPIWTPVILTMGLSFAIDAILAMVWGPQTIFLQPPTRRSVYRLGLGASLNTSDLLLIGEALLLGGLVLIFIRRSALGIRMRAAAESPILASSSGINIHRIYALGWALSSAMAAAAGIGYSINTVLQPSNVSIGLLGLTPALLGGLDSIDGVIVGSVIVALITNFATLYLGDSSLEAVSGIILLGVLLIRPYGLFGSREVVRM